MLAGSDRFELCRPLQAAGVWAPVLMLTARDTSVTRGGGLDTGTDDYLVKPFSLLELAARLPALARRDVRGDLPGSRQLRLGAGPRVVQGLQEPAS